MKIKSLSHRNRGSILLMVVIGTLVVVSGGYCAYQIYKWAVKLTDDGIPRGSATTNSVDTACSPPGAIEYAGWQDCSVTITPGPAMATATAGDPPASFGLAEVLTFLDADGNVALSIRKSNSEVSLSSLGVLYELDSHGNPAYPDLNWTIGTLPDHAGVNYTLERSYDLAQWTQIPVAFLPLIPGITNLFTEPMTTSAFYRATITKP